MNKLDYNLSFNFFYNYSVLNHKFVKQSTYYISKSIIGRPRLNFVYDIFNCDVHGKFRLI